MIISELSERLHLSTEARVTVAEPKQAAPPDRDNTTVITAMNRLKGSGNGKLVNALLQARQQERPSK